MVAVREARKLFRANSLSCFWWARPDVQIRTADVAWVADGLRKHGGREAWRAAGFALQTLAEFRGFVSALPSPHADA
jgi:hypothetical protein